MDKLKKKKILLICVSSQNVITFRAGLIKTLLENGYDVSVVAFDNVYRREIEALGVELYCVNDSNRSMNPFRVLSLKKKYYNIIEKVQPDIVFTFMLKPNIFGVQAAKKAKVKEIYSMVEGAGDVFIYNGLKWKLVRALVCHLYRKAFQSVKKVIFFNDDDITEFCKRKLVKPMQCEKICGVGVDLEKFIYQPIQNQKSFLMIARMIKSKGLFEYCEAARLVRKEYPDAQFYYIGEESEVTMKDVQGYVEDGSVQFLGLQKDVRPYLQACTALILPSYREGFGLVNAEAGATGRAAITCDTVGTKETVKDGYNGFLVEVGDVKSLAEKILYFIQNPEEAVRMGKNSRERAEKEFDRKIVNRKVMDVLSSEA